jgi:hypothetical protein
MSPSLICRFLVAAGLALLPSGASAYQSFDNPFPVDEPLARHVLPADAAVDAESLTGLFQRLTLSEQDVERIEAQIARLNAKSYPEREKATAMLIAEGARALPLLQRPPVGASLEQVKRLQRCAAAVQRPEWQPGLAAAARLLVRHAPKDAAAVLLAYSPFAPDDLPEEILFALDGAVKKAGKVDAALLASLERARPTTRGIAATLVAAHGTADQRKAVLALLDDPDPTVRLRAAQGLLAAGQGAAIPTFIALLKKSPALVAENAEGYLVEVAAATGPKVVWKDTKEDREKSYAAWLAWWHLHKDKLQLAHVQSAFGLVNAERLAKAVGLKCWDVLCGTDLVSLQKVVAIPFRWGDGRTFQSYEEMLAVVNEQKASPDLVKQFTFRQVVPAREFLKVAALDCRDFLNSLQGGKFYVVSWQLNPGTFELGYVVRVRGATARALGVVATR